MKILRELIDDPKLAYHETLNPNLWTQDENEYRLKTEVGDRLRLIARKFAETLKVPAEAITDVVLTGSNANYNWTKLSDVDVHLLVDHEKLGQCADCKVDVEDCLQAKKSLWNDRHDISVFGHPVEVYASNAAQGGIKDAGSYSLYYNDWISKPTRKSVDIDSPAIRVKASELAHEIDSLVASEASDPDSVKEVTDKLWRLRQAGLQQGGEFSVENLVFKALRNNGYLDKIKRYQGQLDDRTLSLEGKVVDFPDRKTQVKDEKVKRIKKVLDSVPREEAAQNSAERQVKDELKRIKQAFLKQRREISMGIRPLVRSYVKDTDPIKVITYEIEETPLAREYAVKHKSELLASLSAEAARYQALKTRAQNLKVVAPTYVLRPIDDALYQVKLARQVIEKFTK